MQDFNNLNIWKRSRKLVLDIYKLANSFPVEEKFGLSQQVRRAIISVPSNIAEGCGRQSDKELIRFFTSLYINNKNEQIK